MTRKSGIQKKWNPDGEKVKFLEGPINRGWLLSVAVIKDGILYLLSEFGNKAGIFWSKPAND